MCFRVYNGGGGGLSLPSLKSWFLKLYGLHSLEHLSFADKYIGEQGWTTRIWSFLLVWMRLWPKVLNKTLHGEKNEMNCIRYIPVPDKHYIVELMWAWVFLTFVIYRYRSGTYISKRINITSTHNGIMLTLFHNIIVGVKPSWKTNTGHWFSIESTGTATLPVYNTVAEPTAFLRLRLQSRFFCGSGL